MELISVFLIITVSYYLLYKFSKIEKEYTYSQCAKLDLLIELPPDIERFWFYVEYSGTVIPAGRFDPNCATAYILPNGKILIKKCLAEDYPRTLEQLQSLIK